MSLTSTLSTIWNNAVNAVESIPDEWNAKVNELKQAVSQFETLYSKLQGQSAIAKTDPALYAEYSSLMSRGNYVKTVITDTLQKLGSALSYAKSVVGMQGMGNLGALPLVPIAVIAGSLALITKWVTDASATSRKLDLLQQSYNDAKARGASSQELNAIAHDAAVSTTGEGIFSGAGDLANKAIWIMLIGGALYLLLPTIKKQLGDK